MISAWESVLKAWGWVVTAVGRGASWGATEEEQEALEVRYGGAGDDTALG